MCCEKFGGSKYHLGHQRVAFDRRRKVLVNPGGPGASIVALNKKDGALDLEEPERSSGYSSAIALQVGNTTQVVSSLTRARRVGSERWKPSLGVSAAANRVANAATPIARDNRVFISSDYGTGGGVVEIKANGSAQEIYFTKDMRNHHSSSVLIGDHLYGFSGGILTAMSLTRAKLPGRTAA